MATDIVTRTVASVQDKRIRLSNSQIARTLTIGTNWTRVRVGIRFSLSGDVSTDLTGTPLLFLGMSSGSANLFADATTTHCVGALISAITWVHNASPVPHYQNINPRTTKRVGTTTTDAGGISMSFDFSNDPDNTRYMYSIDVIKGSPNFSIHGFGATTPPATDITPGDFKTQMGATTPTLTGYGFTTADTIAVDEATDGFLDTAHFYWNRVDNRFEIADFDVARIA